MFGGTAGDPLGLKIEGHHLSLNLTYSQNPSSVPVSVSPVFLGADPAELQAGPDAGLHLLAHEEALVIRLVRSLTAAQKQRMSLAEESLPALLFKPGGEAPFERREGIRAAELSGQQRVLLWDLIREYTGNFSADLARNLDAQIAADGLEQLYLAWAGPWPDQDRSKLESRQPFYYRIQGPSIVIEFDHSGDILSRRRVDDPNHVHSVLRVPGDDFGAAMLAEHYRSSPHHERFSQD